VPFDDEVPTPTRRATLTLLAFEEDSGHRSSPLFQRGRPRRARLRPDSPELRTAAAHLDEALGQLVDGVQRLA
jgi:hypothetical protein